MCCRTSIFPLDREIAATILYIGRFKPTYFAPSDQRIAQTWERLIPEEGVTVIASLAPDSLELTLTPAVSVYAHHFGKRIAAGVYFEIAAKYAEKVGGEIIQRSNVTGCKIEGSDGSLKLASYPSQPMMWERICPGFRAVILNEGGAD